MIFEDRFTTERGQYELLSLLGRGGMGVVYRARSPEGEPVALKRLNVSDAVGERDVRRFHREIRAMQKIRHPHVVPAIDAGISGGFPFLVMPLMTGGSLEELIEGGGALPWRAVVEVGSRLSDALATVHGLGLLHRDLKPSNILLDDMGVPYITDFGLTKDEGRQSLTMALTKKGRLMGSPGFWAPEQAAGDGADCDARTDVYGLGGCLYACLTGRAPVEGRHFVELLVATRELRPPPPSEARGEALHPCWTSWSCAASPRTPATASKALTS